MTERRFSDDEVAQIFERATSGHAVQATHAAEGMTLAGAQRIIELENEIADLRRQLAHPPIPSTAR